MRSTPQPGMSTHKSRGTLNTPTCFVSWSMATSMIESVCIIHGPGRTSAPSTRKFSVRWSRAGSGVGPGVAVAWRGWPPVEASALPQTARRPGRRRRGRRAPRRERMVFLSDIIMVPESKVARTVYRLDGKSAKRRDERPRTDRPSASPAWCVASHDLRYNAHTPPAPKSVPGAAMFYQVIIAMLVLIIIALSVAVVMLWRRTRQVVYGVDEVAEDALKALYHLGHGGQLGPRARADPRRPTSSRAATRSSRASCGGASGSRSRMRASRAIPPCASPPKASGGPSS